MSELIRSGNVVTNVQLKDMPDLTRLRDWNLKDLHVAAVVRAYIRAGLYVEVVATGRDTPYNLLVLLRPKRGDKRNRKRDRGNKRDGETDQTAFYELRRAALKLLGM